MTQKTILKVNNLSYFYPNRKEITLKNINLDIKKGEKVSFIGSNGAGKTTLFMHLVGLLKVSDNTIIIDDKDINKMSQKEKVSKIAILFSDPDTQLIMPTVYEDIAFGPRNLNFTNEQIKLKVDNIINLMNLNDIKNRVSQHLSFGQKKKVALASILSLDPDIIILDEPTANLDPRSKRDIINLINLLNKKGKTIISSTHDMSILSEISNIVYIINKEIISYGTPHKILIEDYLLEKNNLETPDISQFLKILQKMNLNIEEIPLNLKEAILQLIRNINLSKNNGYIKLNYNEELKSLLKNYFSKENIKQKNNI